MKPYLFLVWTVTWSCLWTLGTQTETTTNQSECNEPLIIQCQCGEHGTFQDAYVSSCQVYTADNSSVCEPCPRSCGAYVLCQTCSKEGCLSCPPGRQGQFCEIAANSEANNLNYTEHSEDEMKAYDGIVDRQMNTDSIFSLKSADNIPVDYFPPEKPFKGKRKYKGKLINNKNLKKPIRVTDAVTDAKDGQSKNDTDKYLFSDVFASNDNSEVSHLFSNKTEKYTSVQKSKETRTVLLDSFRENKKDESLPSAIKYENNTDIPDDKFIYVNDSLIINLKKDDFEKIRTENSSKKLDKSSSRWKSFLDSPKAQENGYLEQNEKANNFSDHWIFSSKSPEVHKSANSEKNKEENNASKHWNFFYKSPEVNENDNLEENENSSSSHRKFPHESSEGRESSDSEENGKLNNSSTRRRKFPFESPEVQKGLRVGKYKPESKVMNDQPSERKEYNQMGRFLDIELPPLSFSNRKDSFQTSEPKNVSSHTSIKSENSKINPMGYKLAFVFGKKIGNLKEGNISQIESNKLSNSSKMEIPLNISIFKIKIIDTEGNTSNVDAEFTNATRKQVGAKSSEMHDDKISILSENNSKEFDIVSPLEINIFKITFLGKDSDSPYKNLNSNITEGILTGNGAKSNISQKSRNKTSEVPESIVIGLDAATPQNASIFKVAVFKGNTSSSSDEKKENITIAPLKDNKEPKKNQKRANYKRNATQKPYSGPHYDMDLLQKMIMKPSEFTMNKAKKSDDQQLYGSKSFIKASIPENHVLMPLYFPEMYNAEKYRSIFLDNGQLQKLCDLYPNNSPCFRVRMLSPGSPFTDAFSSQAQILSEQHRHESLPNDIYFYPFSQAKYYDSEGKMNMRSYAENGQNLLTDSQILSLLRQYFQTKNSRYPSLLPFQKSQPLDDTFLSAQANSPRYLIQGWNKEAVSKKELDSTLLSGLMNYLLSFISPKYAEFPAQSASDRHQEFYQNQPGQSMAEREIIEFPLNVKKLLEAIPNTHGGDYSRPFGIGEAQESLADYFSDEASGSNENDNSTSKIVPGTVDSLKISIIHPMFGETSFENGSGNREKVNFLESEALFEPCAKCVFSESVYEPVGGAKKRENSMPTIYRALVVEDENLLFGNQSDSQKQNASRSKRSFDSYGNHTWCPIERKMLNGDLDCTIWSYQKVCTLTCHPGYTCKFNTYSCSRRTNAWNPNLLSCVPVRPYNSVGYRHGGDSLKEGEFNYKADGNGPVENVGNYNYMSVNNSSLFGNMNVNDQEASFPNYVPFAHQRQNDRISMNTSNMSLEIKGNSKFDQIQRLSNNASLDVRVNSKFPINGYSSIVTQDDKVNGNSESGSIQGFPGDLGADKTDFKFYNIQHYPGDMAADRKPDSEIDIIQSFPNDMTADRKQNSNFDNIQGYPGYEMLDGKHNSSVNNIQGSPSVMTASKKENSFYNNQRLPGFEVLGEKDKSTPATILAGDKKDDFELYTIKGVPDEVAPNRENNSQVSKTQDFPNVVVMDGKNINKNVTSEEKIRNAEKIFDMYEKKMPTPKSSSNKEQEPVEKREEKNDQHSDTIYSFFEKENPEPGKGDPW